MSMARCTARVGAGMVRQCGIPTFSRRGDTDVWSCRPGLVWGHARCEDT